MASIRMKFALSVSIMLLVLGILIIAGSVFFYLSLDKALNDFEPVANSYLTSIISTLETAEDSITAAQPSLTSASEMTGGTASTLMNIGFTVVTFGNALGFSILGYRPLADVADPIIHVGSQIQGIGSQLQSISTSLSNTNTQLENMKGSLRGIKSNLENTKTLLTSYFNQAHQTVLLVTGVLGLFGLSISLGGGAVLSLRREINKISDKVKP